MPARRRILRGCFGVAAALAGLVIVVAALAFALLRRDVPQQPRLPGTVERGALAHAGRTRTWLAYVPTKLRTHPEVVIVLHASMGTSERARQVFGYDFDRLAEEHGFLAVYPQGYEGHWNDCKKKGPFAAKAENVDDVGFLHALVDRLAADHGVDRTRVYVTGVSNGGAMTLRLALETPDFARAYAAVLSSVPTPENMAMTPKPHPVSILLMNGTADPMNPWEGGDVALYGVYGNRGPVLSTPASIDYFLNLDGLSGPPTTTQIPDRDPHDGSTAERQTWTAPGKRRVTLVEVHGGGHTTPHPAIRGYRLLGRTNRDFHAAEEIWAFFVQAGEEDSL